MITPGLVRRLRRTGVWSTAQSVHRAVAPRMCAGIHKAVMTVGPKVVSDDLALKHIYDYRVVYVDPRLVTRSLKVGEWHRREPDRPLSRWARFRQWQRLGGGWKSARRHVTRNLHGSFVVDGDWDRRTRPFELHPVILELFEEGRPPQETTEYQRLKGLIEAGRFEWTRGCTTIEELDRYYGQLVAAYETIRVNGYMTQEELGNDGSDDPGVPRPGRTRLRLRRRHASPGHRSRPRPGPCAGTREACALGVGCSVDRAHRCGRRHGTPSRGS